MDEKTLSRLEALIIAAHHQPSQVADTTVPAMVLPAGARIESCERLLMQPNRFEGHYETRSLQGFLTYCTEHLTRNSAVFIDPDKMAANAIIDIGDNTAPGWGTHEATLKLAPTDPYRAVLATARGTESYTQVQLIDWIEDWAPHIRFIDHDQKEIMATKALSSIRRITVSAHGNKTSDRGDFKTSHSAMESVEIKATDEQPLPAGLTFKCEPYEGFPAVVVQCRLRARDAENAVSLHLRLVGHERLVNDTATMFLSLIEKDGISDICPVHIGCMHYR